MDIYGTLCVGVQLIVFTLLCLLWNVVYKHTVEPPNKGDNINSAVLSFVERLSFSRRFKVY